MELLDIVDESGQPTGKTVERSIAHSNGILHRTAHIWIVRKKDDGYDVLLQKRAATKDSFPGCFDTSSAGHVKAGDSPRESAKRELHEELGIDADDADLHFASTFRIHFQKVFHDRLFKDNEVAFVYIYEKPVAIDQLVLQKEEVDQVIWYDLNTLMQTLERHDPRFCVPIDGLRIVDRYVKGE